MNVATSVGWVSINRSLGPNWQVELGAYRGSSRSLRTALLMVGVPATEVREVASRLRHPASAERAPWLVGRQASGSQAL